LDLPPPKTIARFYSFCLAAPQWHPWRLEAAWVVRIENTRGRCWGLCHRRFQGYEKFGVDHQKLYTLRIQVCPKISGFALKSYDLGIGFGRSILLDWDGCGFLGIYKVFTWNLKGMFFLKRNLLLFLSGSHFQGFCFVKLRRSLFQIFTG